MPRAQGTYHCIDSSWLAGKHINMDDTFKIPYAYFITFRTYGTWLHGDSRGSVDRRHNKHAERFLTPNSKLQKVKTAIMKEQPFFLAPEQQIIVLNAIKSTCNHYQWPLFAAHVRTNHVHVILQADKNPEFFLTQLKAYASRELTTIAGFEKRKRIWSKHGSTRYIWSSHLLLPVMQYVLDCQGARMTFFHIDWYQPYANDL